MKFGDVDFCSLCLHRKTCNKRMEESQYKGTMCLAWTEDEVEKSRRIADGKWPDVY